MDGTQSPGNSETDIWSDAGTTRVPFQVYQDAEIYAEELDKIFYGSSWNYVGLECEIPESGDYRRNFIGEREVLMIRKDDGALSVVENRCAHRGAQLCQTLSGNTGSAIMCPYHQWTYTLDGELTGMPFKRGINGKGGLNPDFDMKAHGLVNLRVESLNGVVFASFDHDVPELKEYLGPDMVKYFTRIFNGRGLRVVGYERQVIDCNWKLQMENLKDPYHAGILHLFLISFGLFRLDQESKCLVDDSKGHSVLMTNKGTEEGKEDTGGVKIAAPDFALTDHDLIQPRLEFGDNTTLSIQTLFPSIIIQAQCNTLATRQVIPKGPGSHELVWTFFGFEDDDDEMKNLRLRQANLMGSAGYVTLDDAEALEFSQVGLSGSSAGDAAILEIGGTDCESNDHLVTESLIRGFYMKYRDIMGHGKAGA
jgi:salicylate 5-hydroxylase large subunit